MITQNIILQTSAIIFNCFIQTTLNDIICIINELMQRMKLLAIDV